MDILIATLVVGVIGLVLGVALVATGKKFYVETDPREAAVRELLPGNNCGACGFAGCDAIPPAEGVLHGLAEGVSTKKAVKGEKWKG